MENLSFSELLAIVRVTDERLLGMQEHATKNNISAFGDHPLCDKWNRLFQFNQRAKNVLIGKIKDIGFQEGIDISDCF